MNPWRRPVRFALLGVWLATPAPADAHRLDEYLQATRLSIGVEQVRLEMDLTAGVALADEAFAWIDANHDGQISNVESDAYGREVLRSVALSLDGHPVPITFIEIHVPPFRDMSLGVGTIQVRASAEISATGAPRHQLSYANTHRPERSVYLVNALVPADPRIRIGGLQRDRVQHALTVDYAVTTTAPWARTWSLLAALAMTGILGMTRRTRKVPLASS